MAIFIFGETIPLNRLSTVDCKLTFFFLSNQINNKRIEPISTLHFFLQFGTVSSDVNDCAEPGVFSPFVQFV